MELDSARTPEAVKMDDAAIRASYVEKAHRHGDANAVLDAADLAQTRRGNLYYDYVSKQILQRHLRPSGKDVLLDFGTGVGRLADFIAPSVERIVGVDVTTEMLEIARRKTRSNVSYLLLEDGRIPVGDCVFTKALSFWVLASISDQLLPACLREVCRTLLPGGTFHVFEQTMPNSTVESPLHKKRSIPEYQALFQNAGFSVLSHRHVIRHPSYGMGYWKSKTFLPKVALPLLFLIERLTISRKPALVSYYTTAFSVGKV